MTTSTPDTKSTAAANVLETRQTAADLLVTCCAPPRLHCLLLSYPRIILAILRRPCSSILALSVSAAESEICDHHIERMATKHTLALQRSIRPRLRSIPGFWPFALSNLETFSSLACMSADLDALSSLEDVELVVDWRDPRAYSLVFHFGENKYFSNKTLTRSYVLREGQKGAGEVAKYAEEGGEKDDGEVTEEQLQFDHSEDLKALVSFFVFFQ